MESVDSKTTTAMPEMIPVFIEPFHKKWKFGIALGLIGAFTAFTLARKKGGIVKAWSVLGGVVVGGGIGAVMDMKFREMTSNKIAEDNAKNYNVVKPT